MKRLEPMTAIEYRRAVSQTKLSKEEIEAIFDEGERTHRRHVYGEARVPGGKVLVLRMLVRGKISLRDIRDALDSPG